eukprot:3532916-Karenia_brevis.AAC.1
MPEDQGKGGKSRRDNLRQCFLFTTQLINSQLPEGQKWKLSQWVRAVQAGKTIPGSKEANQMLKDVWDKCTRQRFLTLKTYIGLGAYHTWAGQK